MKTTLSAWELNNNDLELIDLALIEDLGVSYCDKTTALLFPTFKEKVSAVLISKHPQPIIICGLPIVKAVLQKWDDCTVQSNYSDGQVLLPGEILATLTGPAPFLLMSERIILNFLQRLCAIATLTACYVEKINHTTTQILDTRKTLPGFRHLEKYAVQCGGGVNHRMGLYDAIMIKDTHVDLLGGMSVALTRLPDNILQTCPVIIEVRTLDELNILLEKGLHKVTRILLDNMSFVQLEECVDLCKGYVATEASGNMTLDRIAAVAECGVDFISVGKLTHSAGNVDLSMKCGF
ncbi:MAG: quinolinate phosphoribosyltransferase [Gammaproteobacteria bacterium]|jgi:nicotinate-nucleotide pyrophosphorylase (carboxylating)|nr:quinolinate phosphoribosyltransferase [Gammaproteobacteria bacterium]